MGSAEEPVKAKKMQKVKCALNKLFQPLRPKSRTGRDSLCIKDEESEPKVENETDGNKKCPEPTVLTPQGMSENLTKTRMLLLEKKLKTDVKELSVKRQPPDDKLRERNIDLGYDDVIEPRFAQAKQKSNSQCSDDSGYEEPTFSDDLKLKERKLEKNKEYLTEALKHLHISESDKGAITSDAVDATESQRETVISDSETPEAPLETAEDEIAESLEKLAISGEKDSKESAEIDAAKLEANKKKNRHVKCVLVPRGAFPKKERTPVGPYQRQINQVNHSTLSGGAVYVQDAPVLVEPASEQLGFESPQPDLRLPSELQLQPELRSQQELQPQQELQLQSEQRPQSELQSYALEDINFDDCVQKVVDACPSIFELLNFNTAQDTQFGLLAPESAVSTYDTLNGAGISEEDDIFNLNTSGPKYSTYSPRQVFEASPAAYETVTEYNLSPGEENQNYRISPQPDTHDYSLSPQQNVLDYKVPPQIEVGGFNLSNQGDANFDRMFDNAESPQPDMNDYNLSPQQNVLDNKVPPQIEVGGFNLSTQGDANFDRMFDNAEFNTQLAEEFLQNPLNHQNLAGNFNLDFLTPPHSNESRCTSSPTTLSYAEFTSPRSEDFDGSEQTYQFTTSPTQVGRATPTIRLTDVEQEAQEPRLRRTSSMNMSAFKKQMQALAAKYAAMECCRKERPEPVEALKRYLERVPKEKQNKMLIAVSKLSLEDVFNVLYFRVLGALEGATGAAGATVAAAGATGAADDAADVSLFLLACQHLLAVNAQVFLEDDFGLALLSRAAVRCAARPELTRYLVWCVRRALAARAPAHAPREPVFTRTDESGDTLVGALARLGDAHAECLAALVTREPADAPLFDVEQRNKEGYSALHVACRMHDAAAGLRAARTAHVLLAHASLPLTLPDNKAGNTALHAAVEAPGCDLDLVLTLFLHVPNNERKKLACHKNAGTVTPLELARIASRSRKDSFPEEVFQFLKKCR